MKKLLCLVVFLSLCFTARAQDFVLYDGTNFYSVGDGGITQRVCVGIASTSSTTCNVDVAGIKLLWVDTSGGSIALHGFQNGINNQEIRVIKFNQANNMTIKDNGASGTQKIITPSGNDIIYANWGGANLVYRAAVTNWFVTSYSKQ